MKAQALMEAGGAYLDLRRLELAPELTRAGRRGAVERPVRQLRHERRSGGDHGAVTTGSDDVLRVVQTLMAAQVITGGALRVSSEPAAAAPAPPPARSAPPVPPPARPRGT